MSNELDRIKAEMDRHWQAITNLQTQVTVLQTRIQALEDRISKLEAKIDVLLNQNSTISMLIKYIIVPLIIGTFALVGVKVAIPGS